MRQLSRLALSVGFLALGDCKGPSDPVETQAESGAVLNVAHYDISPPLREMAKTARPRLRDDDEIEAEPVRRIPHPSWTGKATTDRVAQRAPAPAEIAATTANFEG